jgi:hypothetical protein
MTITDKENLYKTYSVIYQNGKVIKRTSETVLKQSVAQAEYYKFSKNFSCGEYS